MSEKPKVIKQQDKPVHPDLQRLAKSMQNTLKRRYPDPFERKVVARKIMQQVKTS